MTWRALADRAEGLAGALAAQGVGPGDRVAALVGSDPGFAPLLHAVHLLGATVVPLNARHRAAEIAFAMDDARPGLLVYSRELDALADDARHAAGPLAAASLDALYDAATAWRAPAPSDADTPLALLYTSGTTGQPKGALLPRSAFFWSAVGSAALLGAPPGERWLACMPLYHVGGISILVRSVLFGATVVLHERFDAERVDRAFERDRISIASFVPTMLRRVLALRGEAPRPPTLRCILTGGAPAPATLLADALAGGLPAIPTYGLTEACSQVATLPLESLGRTDRTGRALLGTELAIRGPDGTDLPPDEPGEICVRGPTVMSGYHDRPEATARALRGGWLHTGDVGALDGAGFLQVLDRRTDLVVCGGENVYPAEVEAVLERHPAVAEAAVTAEPDPDLGQRVVAWIVPAGDAPPDLDDLRETAREHLADYKLPRRLRVTASLPRTDSGKLRRARLAGPRA